MNIQKLYHLLVGGLCNRTFGFWQRLGFHVTPVHFYQPIPDTKKLKNEIFERYSQLLGININENNQVELLNNLVVSFKAEYESFFKNNFNVNNGEFESVDAEILYCMVRNFKPKRIIEIGSGYSTLIMAEAINKNKEKNGPPCQLTTIDPYPKDFILNKSQDFFKLIKKEVQGVSLEEFEKLEENDILFVDSSHVLKIGSDVQYEFLEILPQLKKGVIVHFHDIFLPSEYPKSWVLEKHRFFNEQYILQAFLTFNEKFEVLLAASFMHLKFPDLILKAFSSYKKNAWPGSFWMKKIN